MRWSDIVKTVCAVTTTSPGTTLVEMMRPSRGASSGAGLPELVLLAAGGARGVDERGAVGRAHEREHLALLHLGAVGDEDGIDAAGDGRGDVELVLGLHLAAFSQGDVHLAAIDLEIIVDRLGGAPFQAGPDADAGGDEEEGHEDVAPVDPHFLLHGIAPSPRACSQFASELTEFCCACSVVCNCCT
jgi:hypothetical protein